MAVQILAATTSVRVIAVDLNHEDLASAKQIGAHHAVSIRPGIAGIGIPLETRVTVPYWGTRAELTEVIALARAGRITAHIETFSLDNAAEAYEKLRSGKLRGRAVVTPSAAASGARTTGAASNK